jgi:hypothetical protein
MSVEYFKSLGNELYQISKGISTDKFTNVVNAMGGRRALGFYIIPLDCSCHMVIKRHDSLIRVGKVKKYEGEKPNEVAIETFNPNSDESKAMESCLRNVFYELGKRLSKFRDRKQ